ncbi:MAG TPA: 30S ribosome-binding factor RbfA [Bacillota bacterium]|nr:30S ribosome-binding factor RbfA [Bacillota bacterium]
MAFRQDRINEQVRRVISENIRNIKDYRLKNAFLSVTDAQVSKDLSVAKIYYSVLPDGRKETVDLTEIAKGLSSASGWLRNILASELNLRQTPKLTFIYDETAQSAIRISEILKEIKTDEADNT